MKRILLICGCLEPGKDGVGDYVSQLASELIRQGNTIALLSLFDNYVHEINVGALDPTGTAFNQLRIPPAFKSKGKVQILRNWINDFNPDVISLQYVPFAFHPKGLPFGLSRLLNEISGGRKWHIMFHELWVGMDRKAGLKLKAWGIVQQQMIKWMLKTLSPVNIHTQTKLYQLKVNQMGYDCDLLPLMSNIPKNIDCHNDLFLRCDDNRLHFILFGYIHPGAPAALFANQVAGHCRRNNIVPVLSMVGRCGKAAKEWETAFKEENIKVQKFGEQSNSTISHLLMSATYGITTTPYLLIEKSGTVAAMRHHDLPVICVAPPWHPGCEVHHNISNTIEYIGTNLEECLRLTRAKCEMTVSMVSGKLIKALTKQAH